MSLTDDVFCKTGAQGPKWKSKTSAVVPLSPWKAVLIRKAAAAEEKKAVEATKRAVYHRERNQDVKISTLSTLNL